MPQLDAAAATESTLPVSLTTPPHPSAFRRFVEAAILFATLVALVRAVALEPFGVPTGSMAETLVGNHKASNCPRCGYPIVVGSANGTGRPNRDPYVHAHCPNCDETNLNLQAVRECVGDRLLVDKNIFELRKPRRWEVAVFRCPFDSNKPYVKRIVGLPGEHILLKDGDVLVNGIIQRKSAAECRAVRIPVFDNRYQPASQGWRQRWQLGPADLASSDPARNGKMRDAERFCDGANLVLSQLPDGEALLYRHWLLDQNQEAVLRDEHGYNGSGLPHRLHPVHDFGVEFEAEATAGSTMLLVGLRDGHNDLVLELPLATPAAFVQLRERTGKALTMSGAAQSIGQRCRVEFYFFDRRVTVVVDGRELPPYDLPEVSNRNPVSRPCWFAVQGAQVTVRNFRLFRDIHYAANGGECRNGVYEPWPLGHDEYFLLGDNSANSQDSRFWTNAGIPERCFMGKPLLLHQPSHWTRLNAWEVECIDWRRIRWIR